MKGKPPQELLSEQDAQALETWASAFGTEVRRGLDADEAGTNPDAPASAFRTLGFPAHQLSLADDVREAARRIAAPWGPFKNPSLVRWLALGAAVEQLLEAEEAERRRPKIKAGKLPESERRYLADLIRQVQARTGKDRDRAAADVMTEVLRDIRGMGATAAERAAEWEKWLSVSSASLVRMLERDGLLGDKPQT